MKYLFLHPNYPAQYKFIAAKLAQDPNNQVVFFTNKNREVKIPGVNTVFFDPYKEVPKDINIFCSKFVQGSYRAVSVARLCNQLKKQGFIPDGIVAHSGWGDGFYIKSVFPDVPMLNYMEFFFHAKDTDMDFDPPNKVCTTEDIARTTTNNAIHMTNYFNADWCITPTFWQRSVHPPEMHQKITVLHEGVDVDKIAPLKLDSITLPNGVQLNKKDHEIITHVERNLEEHRGFHIFMRAVEKIQKERPNAHFIVIGGDNVSYGWKVEGQKPLRQRMLEELDIDESRIHFLGYQSYENYQKVLNIGHAHIYMTYPFVLSWSFIESLASGCQVICSSTTPLMEATKDNEHVLMFDFHDPEALCDQVYKVLDNPKKYEDLRHNARNLAVEQYNVHKLLPMHIDLINDLARGEIPPPTAKKIKDMHKKHGKNKIWEKSWGAYDHQGHYPKRFYPSVDAA